MNPPELIAVPTISPTVMPTIAYIEPNKEGYNFFTSTMFKVLMLIIILAILGVNLFQYLANTTDLVTKYVSPPVLEILNKMGFVTGETIKIVAKTTDSGIKSASSLATGLVVDSVDLGKNTLKDTVNTKKTYSQPVPDDARNKTQLAKPTNKSGFCYIGEDRGFRSCIEVTDEDTCTSGEIYPSRTICINPNLRP